MGIFGPDVSKLKLNNDVETLIKLLCHKSQKIQKQAMEALSSFSDYSTITKMIAALKKKISFDKDALKHQNLIQLSIPEILISMGKKAVPSLIVILEHDINPQKGPYPISGNILTGNQVKYIANILKKIGSPSAAKVLAEWLIHKIKIGNQHREKELKEGDINVMEMMDSSIVKTIGHGALVDSFKSKSSFNLESLKLSVDASFQLEEREACLAVIDALSSLKDDRRTRKEAIEYAYSNSFIQEIRVAAEKALKNI